MASNVSNNTINVQEIRDEEIKKAEEAIQLLIRTGRLYIMDGDSRVPFPAYKLHKRKDGILLIEGEC
jgi:hypothetical protein